MDDLKLQSKEFGGLRCADPECRQVLFELQNDVLTYVPTPPTCWKCHGEVHVVLSSYSEVELGHLIIRYWCAKCREAFDRKLPSIRKYCKGCKTYHHLFLYAFLGVNQLSALQPEAALQAS